MVAVYDVRIDWNGDGDFTDVGDDVTKRAIRQDITVKYGRDQARSMSPITPGEATFELNNASRDYSPENASSPLAGNILPGRPLRIQATLSGTTYTLFRGHLDEYKVLPDTASRSVEITAVDVLAKFRDVTVSVDLQYSIRTGRAIHLLLDAMDWPTADRDIDIGATTIRWYWEERTDGLTALQRLVNSEGPGAFVFVDENNKFVFRDRHHRLTRTASKTSQATFRGSGMEPVLTRPLVYDHGWRDIINSVTIPVTERQPASQLADVWTSDATYTVADGQTLVVTAESSDPFYAAVVPVAGTDYTLASGAVTITLSRTSGQSTTLFIKATGGPATILGLQLRAYPVRVARTVQVQVEETVSIGRYGRRSMPSTLDAPWVDANDAAAIAEIILAQRAERLPIVRVRLISANDTRLAHQLSRDLSDRITIVDTETGLNGDFYIEQIQHSVVQGGLFLETEFGCEKIPIQPTNVFRFDTAGAGFNDGVFGSIGLDDPNKIFLFDTAGRGFNDGVFAH